MLRLARDYNVPQSIIDIWCRQESTSLLEVQRKAIEEMGLFNGQSIMITAPSSSGKTFVGEMAAVASYFAGKKTIFLVPMKAIAEEKYLDFAQKYSGLGLNIVISTHDHAEHDIAILAGYFDVAVIIFEKMNVLLTQNPAMLNSCGLVVVDEIQLLNDRTRGAGLEVLLTKIKLVKESEPENFQFLGLSAVLADLNRFDEWLGATHCMTQTRPLELHEGVLLPNGTLRVRDFNAGREHNETIPGISAIHVPSGASQNRTGREALEETIMQRLVYLCRYYLGMKKRVLIFRKWRILAVSTAQRLAQELKLSPATQVIQSLGELENTNSRESLIECLGGGVAFHNSDLAPEARLAIESDFRDANGQVQVVCSTSTLAMGVNLPASVVLVPDTLKPDQGAEDFHEVPITASEYKNMAGRAGRTRFGEEGTSILLANSEVEAERYWRNYVHGRLDKLSPPLQNQDLRRVMLGLFAGGLCKNQEEIQAFLLSSYTGYVHWARNPLDPFAKVIAQDCSYLLDRGLLELQPDKSLAATRLGKLCATSGVEIESFILLQNALGRVEATDWEPWEVIFPCLHCAELSDQFRIYIRGYEAAELVQALQQLNPKNLESQLDWSAKVASNREEVGKRVLAFLMLDAWIKGVEMQKIEGTYRTRSRTMSGTIRNIAEIAAWMIQTMSSIARTLDYSEEFVAALRTLGERVALGVPAEGMALRKLGVQGLTRSMIKNLVDAGYVSLDKILEVPADQFRGIISPSVAQRIHESIVKQIEESQERAKRMQMSRMEKHGRDPRVIQAVYEAEGTALENAVIDLLNAPSLELGAEHITRQREGEPDIRLALQSGLLVGSVTASKANVSDTKCAEILRSGARMNPTAFAVFGRPGFHDLAVRNAPHLNNQLDASKSYKLISVKDFGELFVRVVEGRLSKDAFVDVLMTHRGLIQSELIPDTAKGKAES